MENYDLEAYPPGWRFSPEDEEAVYCYLKNKVEQRPLPPVNIREVDIYKFSPDELVERYMPNCERPKEWYFFSPNRRAGNGFWKASGADEVVKMKGQVIGWKRAFVFYYGNPSKSQKTSWIMHEYVLKDAAPTTTSDPDDMKLDVCVLCKIYQNTKKSYTRQENYTFENQSQNQAPQLGVEERIGNSFQNQTFSSHQYLQQQPDGQESSFLAQQNQFSVSHQFMQLGDEAERENNFQNQPALSHQLQYRGQVMRDNSFLQQRQQIPDMTMPYSSMMTTYSNQMPNPITNYNNQTGYLAPVLLTAYDSQNNYVNNTIVPNNFDDHNYVQLPEFP